VRPSSRRGLTRVIETKGGIETEGTKPPFLLYSDDSGLQRSYTLEHNLPVTIGRGEEVDVSLSWDKSVSSVHAEAIRLGAQWLIRDEGISRNGTFVNSERVSGRRRLRHGDVIRVGHTSLAFNEPGGERRGATTIIDAMSTMGTVTLLFTDLVGSTELMDRLGDDAADRLRREHFATLREAAREHGGRVVKSLGDGLMLAFPSALGAVACAVTMQQRIVACDDKADGETMGLRIGLNAGEVISTEDDYFGTPVVVAKRLCDRAEPGQTLLSDVVRALVGSRGDYRFTTLGPLSLKGITDPVRVLELDWASSAAGNSA
jgi:class 3 adenylate cyclase